MSQLNGIFLMKCLDYGGDWPFCRPLGLKESKSGTFQLKSITCQTIVEFVMANGK